MRCRLSILIVLVSCLSISDTYSQSLENQEAKKAALLAQLEAVNSELEDIELQKCIEDLKAIGLPSENYIEHSAMILEYSEAHEQAAWVAHIISPKIIEGTVQRTNDFRPDDKVSTGSAVEEDYLIISLKPDNTYNYDGFGYDRGHLAPSADFRWSRKAVSESFLYSNMSPQIDFFNREIWSELEAALRSYVTAHKVPLYIVTLPVLNDNLPSIERSINKVSIPDSFVKVVLDIENNQSIAFHIKNEKAKDLLPSYAISINQAEELTGYDFFNTVDEKIESRFDKSLWFSDIASGDKEPIYAPSLPRGHFNTVQAKRHAWSGKKVTVCGNVVATRQVKSGLWINLDKQYPNQIFSVFIRKEYFPNFTRDIESMVKNKNYCFRDKIEKSRGVPTMYISKEEQVNHMEEI